MTFTRLAAPLMVALALVPTTPLAAQDDSPMPARLVSIPDTEVHALHAEAVGDDFELWIARPQAGFRPVPDGPVRVLYVLDANLFFGTAVEMTRLMHKLFGELPPLLVVGIAYPTDDGFRQGMLRTRDFTPSEDAGMAARAGSFQRPPETQRVEPAMGGAAAFLRFLVDEVQPFIAARYAVQEDGAMLFGASLGGLFVAHTLLTAPEAFDAFIAVSPALWWNQEEVFEKVSERSRLASDGAAQVFIAVGGLEEAPEIPGLARFKLVTNARRLATHLTEAADPALTVYFEEIDRETHTSVVPVALTRALRQLLRPFPSGG